MTLATAFVDEGYFLGANNPPSAQAHFYDFRSVVSELLSRRFDVRVESKSSGYEMETSHTGYSIYNLLFECPTEANLDPSDVRDLTALIGKCGHFTAGDSTVQVRQSEGSFPTKSLAIVPAFELDRESGLPGIVAANNYYGGQEITLGGPNGEKVCYLLTKPDQITSYFRSAVALADNQDEAFERLKAEAFPELIFAPELKLSRLNFSRPELIRTAVAHLSFLCDQYCSKGEACNWDLPTLQADARANGVDLSDESASTKADNAKMKLRRIEFELAGTLEKFECSMHTKIEPTNGRIHFCVKRKSTVHLIVVGIFHQHLPV